MKLQDLLGVEPQLQHVVAEGEERGQRESAHEDCDEAVLHDQLQVLVEERLPAQPQQLEVPDVLGGLQPGVFLLPAPDDTCQLHQVAQDELIPHEDGRQLDGELHEAAAGGALLLPVAQQAEVAGRGAQELALEEGDVEDRGVVVDELEKVVFHCQRVVKASLSPV